MPLAWYKHACVCVFGQGLGMWLCAQTRHAVCTLCETCPACEGHLSLVQHIWGGGRRIIRRHILFWSVVSILVRRTEPRLPETSSLHKLNHVCKRCCTTQPTLPLLASPPPSPLLSPPPLTILPRCIELVLIPRTVLVHTGPSLPSLFPGLGPPCPSAPPPPPNTHPRQTHAAPFVVDCCHTQGWPRPQCA